MIVNARASKENPSEADRKGSVDDGYRNGAAINAADKATVDDSTPNGTFRCAGGGFGAGEAIWAILGGVDEVKDSFPQRKTR